MAKGSMKLKLGREFIVSCCLWRLERVFGSLPRGFRIWCTSENIRHDRANNLIKVLDTPLLTIKLIWLGMKHFYMQMISSEVTSIKLVWSGWFQDWTLPVQWGKDISWQGHQIRSLRFPGNLQFGVEGIFCFVFI